MQLQQNIDPERWYTKERSETLHATYIVRHNRFCKSVCLECLKYIFFVLCMEYFVDSWALTMLWCHLLSDYLFDNYVPRGFNHKKLYQLGIPSARNGYELSPDPLCRGLTEFLVFMFIELAPFLCIIFVWCFFGYGRAMRIADYYIRKEWLTTDESSPYT